MRTPDSFTRDGLPEDVTDLLAAAERRIKSALEKNTESIFDIGAELEKVKKRLDHGQFGPWLDATFKFTRRTAENYLSVHAKLGEARELVSQFSASTLYLVSSTAADKHRKKIIGEIKSGKLQTDDAVKQRLAKLNPAPEQDFESVKQREANFKAAVELIAKNAGDDLPRLITLLKSIGVRDLAARLEAANKPARQDQAAA